MASKYAKAFTVPPGFPDLLRDLTRELLREYPREHEPQPKDQEYWLLDRAARYFGSRKAMAGAAAHGPNMHDLEARITTIFREADKDNNGVLDHKEFKSVVRAFSKELGLPMSDVRRLMSEADENEDGLIDYTEFVPLAVEVIETIYAKRRFDEEAAHRQAEATEETEAYLLHGMPREKLENTLRDMFNRADADGSGKLSRTEFQTALRESGLGLTRQEINVLLAEVDEDEDGEIDYEEFLPVCFNVLVEIVSKQLEDRRIPKEEVDLRDFFVSLFRDADSEGEGRLAPAVIKATLQSADIGLSIVQLTALMVEAVPDDDSGLVEYSSFAAVAAGIVSRMLAVQTSSDKAAELSEARETGELSLVAGMDRAAFTEALNHAIGLLDPQAQGVAPAAEVGGALADMGLEDHEVAVILQLGDLGDGSVDLDYVGRFAFDSIAAVAEQHMLAEAHGDDGAAAEAAADE
ncbi:hypothetical protein FNF27_06863 [Cafeteria roenbergensis]|uniref:EF-hand domain-containing protein n=1 Tax=Cafeteria roenbergensis TaxID=33653 RepID=A0A5A8E183_CAFRO|nr:hypothetical protein FNF27_06863 [Cafeteria roenbergensis]